jgi:hypothetical protein
VNANGEFQAMKRDNAPMLKQRVAEKIRKIAKKTKRH